MERVLVSLSLKEHVPKDLLHDISHAVLLGNSAVVLYGQNHRIPGESGEKVTCKVTPYPRVQYMYSEL